MNQITDFVVTIDELDRITSIIPTKSMFSYLINQSILTIIPNEYVLRYQEFKQKLKREASCIKFPMNVIINSQMIPCYFNGFLDQSTNYVTIVFNSQTDEDILKKMMILNSQQVNELRSLYKSIHLQDGKAYDEITKLNNELLNSKRIIEKQNAELQSYNLLLKKMATEDSLTGCYNRRYFYEMIREKIFPDQHDMISTIVIIDFNHFKMINDQFGHDAGDRLLITFVQISKKELSHKGEIFRLGGDEFILFFRDQSKEQAETIMNQISSNFAKHSSIVSLAYGILSFSHRNINYDHDLTNLIRQIDELMYQNKNQMKQGMISRI